MKLNRKKVALIVISIISLTFITLLSILLLTIKTFSHLSKSKIDQASSTAKTTIKIIRPFSLLTAEKNSSIELIKHSLELITLLPDTVDNISKLSQLDNSQNHILDINQLLIPIKDLNSKTSIIIKLSEQSFIGKKILNPYQLDKLKIASGLLTDIEVVLNQLVKEPQKWIVIFQNSDEIRATGGFMGSYAIIDINEGRIVEISVEDIYDADGQFNGYLEAPKGIDKYLSQGKGLRLPDSNWNPDFSQSSKQVLQFFALGNKQNVKGIVAVNLDFAKVLLEITGDIEIIDYNTIVNQNNINEVLRSKRDDFFPGSNQKKHLLSQLLTQMQIKVGNLENEKKLQLIGKTLEQARISNIQIYSSNPMIDDILSAKELRKEIKPNPGSDYLLLIESNVGVNKANRNISREVEVKNVDSSRTVNVTFKNNNFVPTKSKLSQFIENQQDTQLTSKEHLGYINYQRVYVNNDWELIEILYDNQPILNWDQKEYKTETALLQEIGFLITLAEQSESKLSLKFSDKTLDDKSIFIQKQPGLGGTLYFISKNNDSTKYILEADQLIRYP